VSQIWYYADPKTNAQRGPLELQELKDVLAKIPNARDALVWREDFSEWKKAGDVPDSRSQTISPPPLPSASSDAQPVWRIRWWWLLFAFTGGNRYGYLMMGWVSKQRRNARAMKRNAA
jgi:GYF domain 2